MKKILLFGFVLMSVSLSAQFRSVTNVFPKKVVTADYTTTAADYTILVNNGTNPVTITLSNNDGQIINVGRINSTSSGVITIASTSGGNIIDEAGASVVTSTVATTTGQRYQTYQVSQGSWVRIR